MQESEELSTELGPGLSCKKIKHGQQLDGLLTVFA